MEIIIHLFVIFIIVLMTSMTASSMEHTLVSDVALLAVVATRNVGSFPAYLPHQDCPWDQLLLFVWRWSGEPGRWMYAFLVDVCTQRCAPVDIAMSLSLVQQVGD